MFVVVFEVQPKAGSEQDYLEVAASLMPGVEAIEGFISVERFESLATLGKFMSVSYWEDEESVKRWREHNRNHLAQLSSRDKSFGEYRITVAEVERQYGTFKPNGAPQ
jgi:heme-degrading monooxygenase HmoA